MTCHVKAKKKTKKNVFDIIGWLWERGGLEGSTTLW